MLRKFTTSAALLLAGIATFANNVTVSNVVANLTVNPNVQFDISWDNSWRSAANIPPTNYDGVWVFAKYRDIDGQWKHLPMFPHDPMNPLTVPTGFNYKLGANLVAGYGGIMLYRSATGSGTSSLTGLRIPVATIHGTGNIDVRVFAVEMVYVVGALITHDLSTNQTFSGGIKIFYGDGDNSTESAYALHTFDNKPADLTAISAPNQDVLYVDAGGLDDASIESTGVVVDVNSIASNNAFPTGHSYFWCMKYEISQAAYRDFLNTLTYTQQDFNTSAAPNSVIGTLALSGLGTRSYIEVATPGIPPSGGNIGTPAVYGCDASNNNIYNQTTDGEWVAVHRISWPQLCAWLDWACLRPMTELEFEVACHGSGGNTFLPAGLGEFAWGYNLRCTNSYTLTNGQQASEVVSNGCNTEGNAVYSNTNNNNGPLRNGIFATATSNRMQAGASYWGIMEMSGNVWERVVTVGNAAGRSYRGMDTLNNGNGKLNDDGHADEDYWPGINGNASTNTTNTLYNSVGGVGVTGAAGSGFRGGAYLSVAPLLRLANREKAAENDATAQNGYGGRGVIYIP